MSSSLSNPFLSKVIRTLRSVRPITPETFSHSVWSGPGEEHLYASLWFRTRGCRFDYQGQCSMCDYWVSSHVSTEQMVAACREGLAAIRPIPQTLVITPSGSMLDEWEVPAEARRAIFQMVHEYPCTRFVFETRPELVTHEKMGELTDLVRDKELCIEMGLESANPWVLRNCVNKNLPLAQFAEAVQIARAHGVTTLANVLVGTAFLSPREAIDDAVHTIRWALQQGVDYCILFPVHIKPWTLLQWLFEHGMYQSPSLWSLVEVLRILGPELCKQTYISWYRPQYKERHISYGKTSTVCPTTCLRCRDQVLDLLDQYRASEDYGAIEHLTRLECDCKTAWLAQVEALDDLPLLARVTQAYETLARELLSEGQWQHYRETVQTQLAMERFA